MTIATCWRDDLTALTKYGTDRVLGVVFGVAFSYIYVAYIPDFGWSLQIYLP
eukprot:Awhi_evm2s10833